MRVLDVSRIASRRRAVWRGGIALPASVFLLGWGVRILSTDAISAVASLATWPLLVLVVLKVARPLRAGEVRAARVAAVLGVAMGLMELLLAARFLDPGTALSWFPAAVVAASAWSARALAAAARAVLGWRPSRPDAALLRVVAPAQAVGVVAAVAATAVTRAGVVGAVVSAPPDVQWAVLLLALAGYLNLRAVAEALARAPEPAGPDRAERLIRTWESPSRRTRFMYGTVLGKLVAVFIGGMGVAMLLLLAAAGPSSLPLLVLVGWFYWWFATFIVRLLGRMQVLHRKHGSFGTHDTRRPDVLYLRSFPTDRWRVRSEAVRHPTGRYGRPLFEDVLVRRLWLHGTVVAGENPGAFSEGAGPVGAAKSRLAAESWHITVDQWMRDASLVVVAAGGTGGLLWELEQLKRLGLQGKLFFVIPPVQPRRWWPRRHGGAGEVAGHWGAVRELVAQVGGMTVPERIDPRRTRAVVPGLGGADAALIVSDGDRDFDYETAVDLAATVTLARQSPPRLPEAVLKALADPGPAARQGAVPRLYDLTFDADPAVRLAANRALERLAQDRSRPVMLEAWRALAAFRPSPRPPPPPPVNPPPAIAGGPVRQPFRHSRFWYWVAGVAVLGSGALLLLAFQAFTSGVDELQRVPLPGQGEVRFDQPGRYSVLYEGPGAADEAAVIPELTVTLTAADGGAVPIAPAQGFMTQSSGGHTGREIGTVSIDRPGTFRLRTVGGRRADHADVAVGQTGAGAFLFVAGFVAVFLFLGGTTLGIVMIMVRGRARQTRPSPAWEPVWEAGATPGWYPDPGRRLELRYWDGLRWTEHVFHGGVQAVDYGPPSRSTEAVSLPGREATTT